MDKKNKVWLIVLIVLLILAVAGMVISRNQLADSQALTAAVNAQLEEAQNASATLVSDLEAAQSALTESQAQVESLTLDLAAQQEKVTALEAAPAEIEAKVAQLEAALESANTLIAELSADAPAEQASASESAVVHVTEATQWRSTPGEEGQAIMELSKGDELNAMNQTSTDALNNEWICAELNGQTGWIPASCAEVKSEADPETTVEAVDAINQQLAAIVDSDATDAEKLSEIAALEDQLSQTIASLSETAAELDAQTAAISEAEAALNAKTSELEAAAATISELEAKIAEITAQTEEDAAARAELEAQLADAQEACAALEVEQAIARAEYEKHLAQINAYLISRELIDGEAHVATTAAREIAVEADGVTAAFDFTNTSVSGNAVVLTIVKDDTELYRSEVIQPGQSVNEITLSEALSAGLHDAIAVTTVYNEDGSVQLTSRVPVALNVAE